MAERRGLWLTCGEPHLIERERCQVDAEGALDDDNRTVNAHVQHLNPGQGSKQDLLRDREANLSDDKMPVRVELSATEAWEEYGIRFLSKCSENRHPS